MLQGLGKLPRFNGGGRKVTLGRPIGDVISYGPTRSATIYVGLNKGKEGPNQEGACKRKPKKFQLRSLDNAFLKEREKQVGKGRVGATRRKGMGWYKGAPESAAAYEVIFIPPDDADKRETSYTEFRKNMNQLAETIGKRMCQDSVIIVHSDGGKRQSCDARWFEGGGDSCG